MTSVKERSKVPARKGASKPTGLTCPACGGTMIPFGDRYKCANCGALL
jgi:ribosomal protein S27AE